MKHLVNAFASDWGSDNTGKDCRDEMLKTFVNSYWFRCPAHLLDLPAKEMKLALIKVKELYELTNALFHDVSAKHVSSAWHEELTMLLAGPSSRNCPAPLATDGTVITKFSGPPFVNTTRWLPYWKWVRWMHKHFLVFMRFVLRRVKNMEGASACRLVVLFESDFMELFASLHATRDVGVPIESGLKKLQLREPHVHIVSLVLNGCCEALEKTKDDVRELYKAGCVLIRTTAHGTTYQSLVRADEWTPSIQQMKQWADWYSTYVLSVAYAKIKTTWLDEYPAKEKRFLDVVVSFNPLTPIDQRVSFDEMKEAIIWEKLMIDQKLVVIDWDMIKTEWAMYLFDSRRITAIGEDDDACANFSPLSEWSSAFMTMCYPTLSPLASCALDVTVDSCEPERVFSVFKRVIVNQPNRHSMGQDKKVAITQATFNAQNGPPGPCRDWPLSEFTTQFGRHSHQKN